MLLNYFNMKKIDREDIISFGEKRKKEQST